MTPVRLNSECIECLLKKYLKFSPDGITEEQRIAYIQKLLKLLAEAPMCSGAPEIVDDISKLLYELFEFKEDYSETKRYFNALMMKMENEIFNNVKTDEDPLRLAICYAMTGNYIDFGAMKNVDSDKLKELLDDSHSIKVNGTELKNLKQDLEKAQKLVYLTDNCGEIVLDKILLNIIRIFYPQVKVDVIVRGIPVLNDVTMEDAVQVGLHEIFDVCDNGSSVAGTCLDRISDDAKAKIDSADVIIAKGQGNFETLRHCGKNIYYIFMCKCMMFARRFDVPQYSGMLVNDLRLGESCQLIEC